MVGNLLQQLKFTSQKKIVTILDYASDRNACRCVEEIRDFALSRGMCVFINELHVSRQFWAH